MRKCILIAVCFCLAALCFSVSRDRSIITYNLEYFSNGAQKELEFYITDSSGTESELKFTFGQPESGDDDEDVHDNN